MADSNNDKERNREKSGTMMMLRIRPIVTKRILCIFLPKGHGGLASCVSVFRDIGNPHLILCGLPIYVVYAVWGLNPRPRDYESLALTG